MTCCMYDNIITGLLATVNDQFCVIDLSHVLVNQYDVIYVINVWNFKPAACSLFKKKTNFCQYSLPVVRGKREHETPLILLKIKHTTKYQKDAFNVDCICCESSIAKMVTVSRSIQGPNICLKKKEKDINL